MNTEEIRAALRECCTLPEGRLKAERLELLALDARSGSDRRLEGAVLLSLIEAYLYGGERDRMPVSFGRLLKIFDEFPAEVGGLAHDIHWTLKWMTSNLAHNPAVPLATAYRWLDEMESRYRQRGYSTRPVLAMRSGLAQDLGDVDAAATAMEAAIAAPRDEMADCDACERNAWGSWRDWAGDDHGALEFWTPILDGDLSCAEEPHRVLSRALLPLLRTGRVEDARGAHLRGYPLARRNVSLRRPVAEHIEFCALTGNEARGLEILTEHVDWLPGRYEDISQRLGFLTGVTVLLRRLSLLGHGDLPIGDRTVATVRTALEQEIGELAARHDARNGTTSISDGVNRRLGRQPLIDRLPLGVPAVLRRPDGPAPGGAATDGVVSDGRAADGVAADSAPEAAPSAAFDALVTEARRLSAAAHPHARKAWNRVAAWSAELPEPVATEVERSRAGVLMESDPAAAYGALLAVAERFTGLGDPARALQTRATAAMARFQAEGTVAAEPEMQALLAEAEAAYGTGELTTSGYLAVRRIRPLMAYFSLQQQQQEQQAEEAEEGRWQAGIEAVRALVATELVIAEKCRAAEPAARVPARPERSVHGHLGNLHEMLAELCLIGNDQTGLGPRLTAAVECYTEAGEDWRTASPSVLLAQLALARDDAQEAEALARHALTHGEGVVSPERTAMTCSLLVEALSLQPDRELDLVEAALTAAARWEGLSEPDVLHNTFNAARAYHQAGRHGEAAALFEEAMPRVEVPYDRQGILMTRQQYADSLRELGRFREAAEQLLKAAQLVQDDPDDRAHHAQLAWAAAESLQDAGAYEESLAAYRRVAELWSALGELVPYVRCRRSVAWLLDWTADQGSGERPGGDGEQAGVAAMREVLAELEAMAANDPNDPSDQVMDELAQTRDQLDRMLARGAEDRNDDGRPG